MSKHEYDIVVVGSGAGGMTAALTAAHKGLSVVILEKAAHFGGSTARSGGGVWIPNNEALIAAGVEDTTDARGPTSTASSATSSRRTGSTPTSTAAPRCCRSC